MLYFIPSEERLPPTHDILNAECLPTEKRLQLSCIAHQEQIWAADLVLIVRPFRLCHSGLFFVRRCPSIRHVFIIVPSSTSRFGSGRLARLLLRSGRQRLRVACSPTPLHPQYLAWQTTTQQACRQ